MLFTININECLNSMLKDKLKKAEMRLIMMVGFCPSMLSSANGLIVDKKTPDQEQN